ncbi:AtpZ/AtpI family protein [Sedimentisphaera salicampi]|uniref:F0F1-ATPase subunit n=1 Tax=Sedimentisphaera salicampi TaxID=1941349 RepID=A0A1W6LP29_9BACT|nr:AtpZ/AtpI family protein [Sedimentisphaera salicampi]ARN57534.1 Putative F0F1-ATPase subunit [Sedimentisphaera salicampi]OXU14396.1 putative F0F1-ATPase subunit [Sedimentisphaera salicampi]
MKDEKDKNSESHGDYYRWVTVGIEYAVLMMLGAFLGSLLDKIQNTEPGFIIIGALSGFALQLYIVLKRNREDEDSGGDSEDKS